jgi:hypothetical protein
MNWTIASACAFAVAGIFLIWFFSDDDEDIK